MSSWATQEDSEDLWYEQSSYAATHIAAIGYGIHASVYAVVMYYTIMQRKSESWRMFVGQLVFNSSLFIFGTINLACSIQYNENAWINDRNYPNGPLAYLFEQQTAPIMTLGNSTTIIISIIADGLLLYRVVMLWNFRWYVALFNGLFYLATVILSILVVVQIALPNSGMKPLSLAVWIVLMVINVVFTAQIAGRIWLHRRTVQHVLGKDQAKLYTGLAAIVVESALPFTILSIILLGLFGDSNTAQNLFVSLLVQLECIGPEMIMMRVVLGRAWSQKTVAPDAISTIKFGPNSNRTQTESSGDISGNHKEEV